MIQFTGYDLLWLFFIYSFAGWVIETAAATFMHRKFSNRGLVNGPLCILYGVGAVAMSVGLQELTGLWLFLFASLYAAVTEFIAGKLIERCIGLCCGEVCQPVGISIACNTATAFGTYCSAGADRCACGGCTRLLSACDRKEQTPGEVAGSK